MSDEDMRAMILATQLPATIVRRIKGKSRIAVRTVGDLHLHTVVIQELFYRYSVYSGKFPKYCVLHNNEFADFAP
jgi:hypothetical protein